MVSCTLALALDTVTFSPSMFEIFSSPLRRMLLLALASQTRLMHSLAMSDLDENRYAVKVLEE